MEKAEYLEIRKHLSFEKPLWVTLLVVAVDVLLFGFALHLLAMEKVLPFLISQILLALFYFHNFALMHEAGHGNLHKTRWVNNLLGHCFSIFCFMPFFAWKHMHQGHHIWVGSINKDPGSRALKQLKSIGKIPLIYAIAWRMWIPSSAIVQHAMLWLYPRRIFKEEKKNKLVFYQSLFSVLFLLSAYVTLYRVFPQWITLSNFGLSIFLYFVITEMINIPHHVNMPHFYSSPTRDKLHPWEQHISTRSCYYPGFLSELIALNFNLHIEHHYFPNLPWYRLKKLQHILKPKLGSEYTEVSDVVWCVRNHAKSAQDVFLPDVTHPLLQQMR